MSEHSKYKTYIEQWNIKKRWCYNFSFQIRKILSYLWSEVEIVSDYNDAEIIIMLSCIAVPEFIKNNYQYIDSYLKKEKQIILYGCVSNTIRNEITSKYWNNIILIDHESEYKFDEIYKTIKNEFQKTEEKIIDNSYIFWEYVESNYHIIIGKWCMHNCSFCVVREWKKIMSFTNDMIMKSFEKKYKSWIKHFRITSDDIWTYWIENNLNLFILIDKILSYNKDITLELWPIYPWFILDNKDSFLKIIQTWRITEIFTAIQHRKPRILKLMNRIYDHNAFEQLMLDIKKDTPQIKLSTHLIYWFPTETHAEFLSNLKNIRFFDQIQFYRFSKTYKMKDLIFKEFPIETLEERKDYIRKIFSNKEWLVLEEDRTKLVVIKRWNKDTKSFVKKYF